MNTTPPLATRQPNPRDASTWSRRLAWTAAPVMAAVVVFHRNDPADAMELAGSTATWIWIHVVLLAGLALLAHAITTLLVGLDGRAATVVRALLPFALVSYAAFDALVGLGTGVLVERADTLGPDAAELVAHWWSVPTPINIVSGVAQLSWVVVIGATAIARATHTAPRFLVPALVALAATFPLLHVRPIGLVPVALLVVALWLDHRPPADRAPSTRARRTRRRSGDESTHALSIRLQPTWTETI